MRPITKEKFDSFIQFMQKNSIDAILIADWENSHDVNMLYLSGHPMDATFVITNSGETCLAPWDIQLAQDHAEVETILDFKNYQNRWSDAAIQFITNSTKKDNPTIGVSDNIPYKYLIDINKKLPKAKIFKEPSLITNKLTELRATKSPKELDKLLQAGKIGSKTIKDIEKFVKENKKITENDLSFFVKKKIRENGAEDNSFDSLVANTTRSHMIHCHPKAGNGRLAENGLALIDFGALFDGYASDITIPMTFGKLTAEQEKIKNTTLKAYKAAIDTIDVNIPLWKISKAAIDIIEAAGYTMPHSLGHGLGLTVHDSPFIRQKPTDPIGLADWQEIVVEEGMVFTIEPGIYVKGLGGQRLENNVLIRNNKIVVYTESKLLEL